jgi:hypothetical protein
MEQLDTSDKKRNCLSRILFSVFLFALIMGPGPGLYLINGYAARGGTVLGLPALYFWAVLWFVVETAVVLVAYRTIWRERGE